MNRSEFMDFLLERGEYETLLNSIAKCGIYYRSLVDDSNYHHGQRVVTIPIQELGNICLVENCVWEDVRVKLGEKGRR